MKNLQTFNEFLTESTTTPTITWLVGPPASGKSTWQESNAKGSFVISRDDLVDELRKGTGMSYSDTFNDSSFQNRVNQALENRIKKGLSVSTNVVVDMTNMTVKSRERLMLRVPLHWKKVAVVFETPRSEILKRLKKREEETGKKVGIDIVDRMIKSYEKPTKSEGFDEIIFLK